MSLPSATINAMKRCKKCGLTKPVDAFYRDSAARDGRRPECKDCTRQRRQRWYRSHRDEEIARVKAWQQANRERHLAAQRARYPKRRDQEREGHLNRKFGITQDDYDRMLREQAGGCAICGGSPRKDASFHVDHDHDTDTVRGLLCFRCNAGIGQFRELPARLRQAAEYLDLTRSDWIEQPTIARLAKDRARELTRVGP